MATEPHPMDERGGPPRAPAPAYEPAHGRGALRRVARVGRRVGSSLERVDEAAMARALGWFSIGLGLAQLLAPRALGRAIGVGERPGLIRMLGLRELANGTGLLVAKRRGPWAWARVGGDMMDMALLGAAARADGASSAEDTSAGNRRRIAVAGVAVIGVTALDIYAAQKLHRTEAARAPAAMEVRRSVTVNALPEKLYSFWRDFENLPRFMKHLESVSVAGGNISHWVAKAPAGTSVEWDAEIVEEQPGRRLAWRTLPDSELFHEGSVEFQPAPGGRGTIVRVDMRYRPPGGRIGARLARFAGEEPDLQVYEDLRRFKQLIETGEIASTQGQSAGRRSVIGRMSLGGRLS